MRESYLNELYQLPARKESRSYSLKRKLKRAEEQISACEEKHQEWNVEKSILTAACQALKSERNGYEKKGENKCLRLRLSSCRIENMKLKSVINTHKMKADEKQYETAELSTNLRQASEESADYQKELDKLRTEIKELVSSVEYLQSLINDTNELALLDEIKP
ncbi:hypothetical protein CHS0354_025259 [Potamilus streckersoni]|uniref:Uncharacterized protein n=1 Tax=Potamilus streckersoni TaxID=2493646 RepID=A0AAE0VHK0_9BIVA|nr:hypothetical protein CHS0354_025259 [Potamilus streckersoni]